MRIGSGIAVVVVEAGCCNSDTTPSLETSTCCGCGPKKKTKKERSRSKDLLVCDWLTALAKCLLPPHPYPVTKKKKKNKPNNQKNNFVEVRTFNVRSTFLIGAQSTIVNYRHNIV